MYKFLGMSWFIPVIEFLLFIHFQSDCVLVKLVYSSDLTIY